MRFWILTFLIIALPTISAAERRVEFENQFARDEISPHVYGECTGYRTGNGVNGSLFTTPKWQDCTDLELCRILTKTENYGWVRTNNWANKFWPNPFYKGVKRGTKKWLRVAMSRGLTPDQCLDILVAKYKAAGGKLSKSTNAVKKSQPSSTSISLLGVSFQKLPESERKRVQLTLQELGFYRSSIDGLYGKGTAAALKEYNKQYFSNANLEKQEFVTGLLQDTLAYKKPDTNVVKIANADNSVAETPIVSEEVTEHETGEDASPVKRSFYDAYVAGDYKLAFSLARSIAIKGDPYAQLYLGIMFEEGKGTLPLNTNAYMWYSIADLNGEINADLRRMLLTDRMTNSSVEEAQNMARACLESGYNDCSFVKSNSISPSQKPAQDTIIYITDGDQMQSAFVKSGTLKRKQLQYALKAMRLYNGSIDGLWGKNTSNGFDQFLGFNLVETTDATKVFDKLLSLVKVPSSFESAKPKNVARRADKKPKEECVSILSMLGIPICNENPTWNSNQGRSNSDNSPSMIFSNGLGECNTDFDCGFGNKCVKRAGLKSICIKPSDKFGNSAGGIGSTLASCRTRADCPALYSCDRSRGICIRD